MRCGTAAPVRWPTGWRRWATTTSRTSAPSSAGSPARSAATRSSTCCRSGAGSTGSWSARRARSAVVLEATVRLVADETGRLLRRARLPVDGRGRRRRAGAAGGGWRPADRLRGAGRPDRRPGEGQGSGGAGAPAGRRLAVRGGRGRGRAAPWPSKVVAASAALGHRTVTDVAEQAALWRIREDGAGLAARSLRTPAYSGWEDAAVPPERLGAWLRDFDELLREHDLDGVPYGHFGDGCVHVRIDFPFAPGDPRGPKVFRDFLTASAPQAARAPRLAVRRARRRPRALGAAAADVRRGVADAVRRREGGVRPAQPAQPRQPGRPGTARRRPAAGAAAGRRPERAPAGPRRRLPGRRRAPLHRRRQVRRAVHQRRDVPVVPRHPRREGRHPGPRPGPAGGARRLAGEGPRRPCRGRGARPLPGLQGVRVRLPDRRGHGDLQGRGAAPEARRGGRTPPAQPLPARPAAPVGGPGRAGGRRWRTGCCGSGPVARMARATAGIDQRRSIPAFAPHHAAQVRADERRRARTSGSGPTRSATTSSRATGTRRSATSSRSV